MSGGGSSGEVTRLLAAAGAGDRRSAAEVLPLVYEQLRAIARRRMAAERSDHTLEPTALVHEAYARLVGGGDPGWDTRGHFYAAAGEAMRRILIEHARARGRVKRGGGGAMRVSLEGLSLSECQDPAILLDLDAAFRRMEEQAPQMADVVRLRLFAGLSGEQAAAALGVSPATVKRRWTWARSWLFREMKETTDGGAGRRADGS